MNDLDILMLTRIEEINTKTPPLPPEDIDTLIAYHRRNRERKARGEKPVTRATVDLTAVLERIAPKPEVKFSRRLGK